MTELWNLEPEDLPNLKSAVAHNRKAYDDFLASVVSYLSRTAADGGANDDLLYTTGLVLAKGNIWDEVPPADLATRVGQKARRDVLGIFFRTVPGYLSAVLSEIELAKTSRGKMFVSKVERGSILEVDPRREPAGKWVIRDKSQSRIYSDPVIGHWTWPESGSVKAQNAAKRAKIKVNAVFVQYEGKLFAEVDMPSRRKATDKATRPTRQK
ncbi:hypothetical protein Rleg4DRAFT_1796 [Rhizobium leguminosarum bv. trifolii WSM2297]|uniref:Uncharacterized protein n=1 Tax=Rhizobium leguminosarum bv. trifolii WSM2297 TaxID=754762 RepID=J0CAQ0_RHILT|nr:hypothetical protein [Rhizobium leguminosarum]EJC80182.1 hypothetical protein Rleg4DRAFT_1796 [Rhizobium leguminosarum bv. trifolii WSM2297]